jgi:Preprotein translocase subunit SecA (ATPase, RNA helicase)
MFNFLKIEEDTPLEHPLLTKTIENAQRKVETHNFDIRKYVLEYDNVLNKQREIIYTERQKVLSGEDLSETVLANLDRACDDMVANHASTELAVQEWDIKTLHSELMDLTAGVVRDVEFKDREELLENLKESVKAAYNDRETKFGHETMREIERFVLLYVVDQKWKDHLYNMDILREGIGLRSYAQKNPVQEYQNEAFLMFQRMLNSIWEDTIKYLFRVELQADSSQQQKQTRTRTNEDDIKTAPAKSSRGDEPERQGETSRTMRPSSGGHTASEPIRRHGDKVGRNDPCPCGSGKKYKHCCGAGQ